MRVSLRTYGFPACRESLRLLTTATKRNTVRKVMRRHLEPFAKRVTARAPYKFGTLKGTLDRGIGTKLTRRQRSLDTFSKSVDHVMHFGTADPAGLQAEFGLGHSPLQPFFRPEWESGKRSMRDGILRDMKGEIEAAAARARRKIARGTR